MLALAAAEFAGCDIKREAKPAVVHAGLESELHIAEGLWGFGEVHFLWFANNFSEPALKWVLSIGADLEPTKMPPPIGVSANGFGAGNRGVWLEPVIPHTSSAPPSSPVSQSPPRARRDSREARGTRPVSCQGFFRGLRGRFGRGFLRSFYWFKWF